MKRNFGQLYTNAFNWLIQSYFCLIYQIFFYVFENKDSNFLRNDIFNIASAFSSLFILKTIVRTKNFPYYEN